MKTTINDHKLYYQTAEEQFKIETIKNLIFGENISIYNQEFENLKKDFFLNKNRFQKSRANY